MKRFALITVATVSLAACAEEPMGLGAPAPAPYAGAASSSGSASVFRTEDFAWSTQAGSGTIVGSLALRSAASRYTCQGGDVILTPETPWTRRRMFILYGSPVAAAVPLDIVRARTSSAPSGDYARFAKKTTCDSDNHFSFAGLPDGGWFVITLAKPVDTPGDAVAVMRRVETRGGLRTVTLN